MTLRRTRWLTAATIAVLATVMALVPLLAWRGQRASAIDRQFDDDLVALMEEVQRTRLAGVGELDFDAWEVANDEEGQWIDPLAPESELEPPLLTWISDAGEFAGFRNYAVDDESYRAYVRPVVEGRGFVTLLHTGDRDRRLGDVDQRAVWLAGLLALIAAGAGWWIAGRALSPTKRVVEAQHGFLADAAHEMRTPLAVILASSSQALARPRSDQEYVRSLSEIRAAAERASSGVNELLDLVRFDTGQTVPRLAPLRLDLLAEEVAASVRADECEVVAEPGEAVVVQADMPLLRQALDNVVRNAARRASRVELTTARSGRDGVVKVTDNGPGFDPSIVADVFDRYRRGDRNGEVGLGLSIVKSIVAAHGGEVSARNLDGDTGSGAVVELRIPVVNGT